MTIGEKIKNARKIKQMTQAQLADGKITRNMISAIENGSATPSLETVKLIANSLDMPAAYFVSSDDDLFFFIKKEEIKTIRRAYAAREFESCIKHVKKIGALDDELAYILASANFELGREYTMKGSLKSALSCLSLAEEYCAKTIYDTNRIKGLLPLYKALSKNIQSPLLEFDEQVYKLGLVEGFEYELYKYTIMDFDYDFTESIFAVHMEAKRKLRERDYSRALALLLRIENEKTPKNYNACVMFGVYSDIENCYRQLYDFENAYRYSTKRISLLESFNS